jgi:hypothetical protein
MFVLSRNVSAGYKVIATLVTAALLLGAFGFNSFARAANITDVYDLLSDSSPAASSTHTIQFVTPSGVAAGETIVIDFGAGFNPSALDYEDVDLATSTDAVLAAAPSNGAWGVTTDATSITFTSGTSAIAPNATVTIEIGTNATFGVAGNTNIVNPTPPLGNESYEISISAGTADSGYTRVVILNTVLVTANVQTTFEFTVIGNGIGEDANGETTTLAGSSTTIPFGTLVAGQAEVISQDLTVQTNAINGFVVTVQSDGPFESSTGAIIDGFSNGSDTNIPGTWAGNPLLNDINDPTTWGHWGITTEDNDADGMRDSDDFAANEFIALTTSPRAIFAHDGPADATTPNIGSTTVAYKVEITALQEAADDYSTVLTYIATPTF